MELFAAGFNAWDQLSFDLCLNGGKQGDRKAAEEEPRDLHGFVSILAGGTLERPVARLSYTVVRRDGRLCVAGLGVGPASGNKDIEFLYASSETVTGEILAIHSSSADSSSPPSSNVLVRYPSLAAWQSHANDQRQCCSWPCTPPAKQLAAFDTGFVVLYADGSVATLGDGRFEGSLGRDITAEQPAEAPGLVPDLHGIAHDNDPVRHVTAGGCCVAALTASGSVYVWGTPSAGTHRRRQAFSGLNGVPNYSEVGGGKDVADVALGDSHAVALTTDGCVYVVGENSNGQLGLGRGFGDGVEEWTRVPFEPADGCEVIGVAAGPKSSFILTGRIQGRK